MLVVIIGVVFVLMTVLVPQLALDLQALVPKLPRETEVLIFAVEHLRALVVPAAGPARASPASPSGSLATTNERVQRSLDELSLKLPVLGPLRTKIILARFSTFFAMLYRAGISVLECIQICEKIVGNRVMEEGLQRVGRSISEGQGISQAFVATKLFPPLVLRMLRVGESTGRARHGAAQRELLLQPRGARRHRARCRRCWARRPRSILGLLIVGILYSIFLPIYDVIAKIKF